jgi:hypothetical protein
LSDTFPNSKIDLCELCFAFSSRYAFMSESICTPNVPSSGGFGSQKSRQSQALFSDKVDSMEQTERQFSDTKCENCLLFQTRTSNLKNFLLISWCDIDIGGLGRTYKAHWFLTFSNVLKSFLIFISEDSRQGDPLEQDKQSF